MPTFARFRYVLFDESEISNAEWRDIVTNLEKDKSQNLEHIESIEKLIAALEKERVDLLMEIENAGMQVVTQSYTIKEQSEQLTKLQDKLGDLNREILDKNEKITELENANGKIMSKLKEVVEALKQKKQENDELNLEMEEMRDSFDDQKLKWQSLIQQTIEKVKQDFETHQTIETDLRTKISQLEQDLENERNERSSNSIKLQFANEENKQLKSIIEELQTKQQTTEK